MLILALDTTAKTAGLALCEAKDNGDVRLISEYSVRTASHSTTLLPMIESMLSVHGYTSADIGLFAASNGPGSFTGVRIGVSTVKGLAFVSGAPCVGVSALEGMAWGFDKLPGLVFPAIDARRGTVYTAAFFSDGEGNVTRLTEDGQLEWDEHVSNAMGIAEGYPDSLYYGCGDGYDIARENPLEVSTPPVHIAYTTGYGIARAAWKKYMEAEDRSVFTEAALAPVYLKKSQAERERDERIAQENA